MGDTISFQFYFKSYNIARIVFRRMTSLGITSFSRQKNRENVKRSIKEEAINNILLHEASANNFVISKGWCSLVSWDCLDLILPTKV